MNIGKTLFAQLMDFLPWSTFARIVARYGGDARVRTFCCAEQYRAMAFAQLTYRESLRDIEVCLSAQALRSIPQQCPLHLSISAPIYLRGKSPVVSLTFAYDLLRFETSNEVAGFLAVGVAAIASRSGRSISSMVLSSHPAGPSGLFNAHYRPLYERLTAGSRAAVQRASEMLVTPLARAMLSA